MEISQNSRADKKKGSGWSKVVDLILRSCHLGISSVLFGGFVWEVPFARLANWHHLVIVMTVLTAGVVGSHMPAFLRHWFIVHRRVL